MRHWELRAVELLDRLDDTDPVGAEVGVWLGQMSRELLNRHPKLRLYMVDNWAPARERPKAYVDTGDRCTRMNAPQQEQNKATALGATAFAEDRRTVLHMDSALGAAEIIEPLDFVFIDADHSYPAVRRDIEVWLPKLRDGGLLSGHDYTLPGVQPAVDEAVERHGWHLDLGRQNTWFVRLS